MRRSEDVAVMAEKEVNMRFRNWNTRLTLSSPEETSSSSGSSSVDGLKNAASKSAPNTPLPKEVVVDPTRFKNSDSIQEETEKELREEASNAENGAVQKTK